MQNKDRRAFIKKGLLGLAVAPFGVSMISRSAFAAMPMLDPNAPNAKALNYVEDAAQATSHPAFKANSKCANCALYQASGACPLFAGHKVDANGWCQAWVKKP
ncbi:high potential iron-sulfur protein [Marinomonas piezotolerans]|uniref:High-potential iron-sulfur protein n=1 Tax=Marinomonas piezotolerans TaxID=2213058 RepID=A0A370UD84_9GAMM|nr:high-potential iron-sulfur protein [Marinomonas piezotolerans]RDL45746.1 high potential iron-sulfur protein [Marinomonas piezotolerans]